MNERPAPLKPVKIDWDRVLMLAAVVHLFGREYDWFPANAILTGYAIAVAIVLALVVYVNRGRR